MIRPRNTLVVCKLMEKSARRVGAIVVPAGKDQYTEAVVMGVGPGNIAAGGGLSDTHDLKVGQVVWVKHKKPSGRFEGALDPTGLPYRIANEEYVLFEQAYIAAILADSTEEREQQLGEEQAEEIDAKARQSKILMN